MHTPTRTLLLTILVSSSILVLLPYEPNTQTPRVYPRSTPVFRVGSGAEELFEPAALPFLRAQQFLQLYGSTTLVPQIPGVNQTDIHYRTKPVPNTVYLACLLYTSPSPRD